MGVIFNKTFLAICLALLIVGAAVFFFTSSYIKYGQAQPQSIAVIKAVQEKAAAETAKIDSDGDGLKDWEETLWGADAQDPDSDGDGTEDGKEVDAGRNPMLPGPDDELDQSDLGGASTGSSMREKEPTATERLAGAFFTQYLTLRQTGEINTAEGQQFILQMAIEEANRLPDTYAALTERDILVGPQKGEESIRNYGNVVGSIIERHGIAGDDSISILMRAIEEEKEERLEALIPLKAAYANMATELKTVVVPKEAVNTHLQLLNSLSGLAHTIGEFEKVFTDPVITLRGVQRYPKNIELLVTALVSFHQLMSANAIEFEKSEPGYVLQSMITVTP